MAEAIDAQEAAGMVDGIIGDGAQDAVFEQRRDGAAAAAAPGGSSRRATFYSAEETVEAVPDEALDTDDDFLEEIGTSFFDIDSGGGLGAMAGASAGVAAGQRRNNFDFSSFDSALADIAAKRKKEAADDEDASEVDLSSLSRSERRKMNKALKDSFGDSGVTIEGYKHLMALKPRERYLFRSDYFMVDDEYACILGFFHDDAATDAFPPFWGIYRAPMNLAKPGEPEVTAILLEQVSRHTDKWIDDNLKNMDKLDKLEDREQAEGGTMSTKRRAAKVSDDMQYVVAELQNGASYLHVHQRLLLRTGSLEMLEEVLKRLKSRFIENLPTVTAAPYEGEQRQELSSLTSWNRSKRGKGQHFTSTEFAGAYSLVTNGLNDPGGEYVGYLSGDVNNSAILFDVDAWSRLVVIADEAVTRRVGRLRVSDMWASKVSQAALINGRRVVHIVLNDADLDKLGPPMEGMTSKVDLNAGEVNMFEVFGDVDNELSLYATHSRKLMLMAELVYGENDPEARTMIRNRMSGILNEFYTDLRMWTPNAKDNRDDIRLVGLPHTEVPTLHKFTAYLERHYESEKNSRFPDEDLQNAYRKIADLFNNLLEFNGDLFNNVTSESIDSVHDSRRVIYDFSTLARRGRGVALAQLVNVIGFAVESLQEGDTIIIHGTQEIEDVRVHHYLKEQFKYLIGRGGRVAYAYDSVDAMIADAGFNNFDAADWTVLGPMGSNTVTEYQQVMGQSIPTDLAMRLSVRDSGNSYLRRGVSNVLFRTDLALGINPMRGSDGKLRAGATDGIHGDSARGINRGGGTADGDGSEETLPQEMFEQEQKRQERVLAKTGRTKRLERDIAEKSAARALPKSGEDSRGADTPGGAYGAPDSVGPKVFGSVTG